MKKEIIKCSIEFITENDLELIRFNTKVKEIASNLVAGGMVEWKDRNASGRKLTAYERAFSIYYETDDPQHSKGPAFVKSSDPANKKAEKELEEARKTIKEQTEQITALNRVILSMQGNPDEEARKAFNETLRKIVAPILDFDPTSK